MMMMMMIIQVQEHATVLAFLTPTVSNPKQIRDKNKTRKSCIYLHMLCLIIDRRVVRHEGNIQHNTEKETKSNAPIQQCAAFISSNLDPREMGAYYHILLKLFKLK